MTAISDPDSPAENRRRRRRWPWIIVFVIVAALVAAAAVAGAYLWRVTSSFDKAEVIPTEEVFPTERPAEVNADAVNILLLGSDSRNGLGSSVENIRGQRADTMLLVHIPADRQDVQVISFMRDNWVTIPGHGEHKLNAALSLGGVPLLVQTLESIVNVPIDHVAVTDFEGFKGLSEALDGVTVNNEVPFSTNGFDYAAGPIELRGDAALAYVRARYPFPDGDYQRVRNQQAFIKGMVQKMLSSETLSNPGRIVDTVDALSPYLAVDATMNSGTLAPIAFSLRNVRSDNITFLTSPTLGTGTSADGQSIVVPDWTKLAALSEALKNDTVAEYAAANP